MNAKNTAMLITVFVLALIGLYWVESILKSGGNEQYTLHFRIAYGVIGLAFLAVCGWAVRLGWLRWKESQQELEESEQMFLEEAEREIAGGGLAMGGAAGVVGESDGSSGRDGNTGNDGKYGTDGTDRTDGMRGTQVALEFQNSQNPLVSPASHNFCSSQDSQSFQASQDSQTSQAGPPGGVGVPGMPVFSAAAQKRIGDLTRLGVVTTYEGKVDLPAPALPAPIYRLRAGGLVLFLDQLENQRFLAFQARRFRAIVVEGGDGEPVVVRRYQDFLGEEMEGPK